MLTQWVRDLDADTAARDVAASNNIEGDGGSSSRHAYPVAGFDGFYDVAELRCVVLVPSVVFACIAVSLPLSRSEASWMVVLPCRYIPYEQRLRHREGGGLHLCVVLCVGATSSVNASLCVSLQHPFTVFLKIDFTGCPKTTEGKLKFGFKISTETMIVTPGVSHNGTGTTRHQMRASEMQME